MLESFGVIAPERKVRIARTEFDTLRQTSTVETFAYELRKLVRIMAPMELIRPSEGDIVRRHSSMAASLRCGHGL